MEKKWKIRLSASFMFSFFFFTEYQIQKLLFYIRRGKKIFFLNQYFFSALERALMCGTIQSSRLKPIDALIFFSLGIVSEKFLVAGTVLGRCLFQICATYLSFCLLTHYLGFVSVVATLLVFS